MILCAASTGSRHSKSSMKALPVPPGIIPRGTLYALSDSIKPLTASCIVPSPPKTHKPSNSDKSLLIIKSVIDPG